MIGFSRLDLSFNFCCTAGSFHYLNKIPFLVVLYKTEDLFIQLCFVHSVSFFLIREFINVLQPLDLVQMRLGGIRG